MKGLLSNLTGVWERIRNTRTAELSETEIAARKQGYEAFWADLRYNPHLAGSREAIAWMKGYREAEEFDERIY